MSLSNRHAGLFFAIVAPLLYALKSICIKAAPPANVETFVFLRFFFDFLLLLPFFIRYRKEIGKQRLHLHLFRAVLVVLSIFCSVYGIKNLALIDAILLENTLPLFIPLVFWVWFRKKITLTSFMGLLVGFGSLFFLLKPKLDILHLASLASLGVGFLAATTAISIRALSSTEHPIAIIFYLELFSCLLSGGPCLYKWEGGYPLSFWFYLPAISFFGVLFQYAITKAYSLTPPHIVGGFTYFSVLYSVLFGWLFWKEPLDTTQIIGGSLLILSGLFLIYQNSKPEKAQSVLAEL